MREKYVLEFEIKGLPKMTNQLNRSKWQARMTHVKRWKCCVLAAVGKNRPLAACQRATLHLTRHSSREPDFDGLVSSFKPIIDALVDIGVLQNDRMSNIGQPVYRWEQAKGRQGKIHVRVEEA